MVRSNDLKLAILSLAAATLACPAQAQPQLTPTASFPFESRELAQQVNNLLRAKGLSGSFQRDNCQETETQGGPVNSCDYSFYNLRYRLWQQPGSQRVALITARPRYASRYDLNETAALGMSVVIGAVEGSDNDADILAITDRLRSAGRSMGGSSTVETKNNRYELSVGRDGYTFWVSSRAE